MPAALFDVFVSYRHDGGAELAQVVHNGLAQRGYRAFMDVRNLGSGPFDAALEQSIEQASDVVVLLTPTALDRCRGDADWMRREIRHALAQGVNVVPVLAPRFSMPAAAALPADIAELTRMQAVTYVHEHSDACLDKLAGLLQSRPRFYVLQTLKDIGPLSGLLSLPLSLGPLLWSKPDGGTGGDPGASAAEIKLLEDRIEALEYQLRYEVARRDAGMASNYEPAVVGCELARAKAVLASARSDAATALQHLREAEAHAREEFRVIKVRVDEGMNEDVHKVVNALVRWSDAQIAVLRAERLVVRGEG